MRFTETNPVRLLSAANRFRLMFGHPLLPDMQPAISCLKMSLEAAQINLPEYERLNNGRQVEFCKTCIASYTEAILILESHAAKPRPCQEPCPTLQSPPTPLPAGTESSALPAAPVTSTPPTPAG